MVGQIRDAIPSKVHVLRHAISPRGRRWRCDYKAVAHAVVMAAADEDNIWIATDSGMILKLGQ